MRFMNKICLLILVVTSAFYGSQANANLTTPLGTIPSLFSYTTTNTGSDSIFTDIWTFQVAANALLNDSQSSTGITGLYTQGVDLTSVKLFDGASLVATGTLTAAVTVVPTTPALTITNYFENLSNIVLTTGHQYTLQVQGNYLGTVGGSYTGTLSTSPSAVPVPAAIWLFGSALAGFIGFNRRRPLQQAARYSCVI
jgi:hypothetical protein